MMVIQKHKKMIDNVIIHEKIMEQIKVLVLVLEVEMVVEMDLIYDLFRMKIIVKMKIIKTWKNQDALKDDESFNEKKIFFCSYEQRWLKIILVKKKTLKDITWSSSIKSFSSSSFSSLWRNEEMVIIWSKNRNSYITKLQIRICWCKVSR